MRARFFPVIAMVGVGVLSGCHDSTGPDAATAAAAGIYVLQPSSSGGGYGAPLSGTMYLAPSGQVERRAFYPSATGGTTESVMNGTFRVHGTSVELRLLEVTGGTTYPWSPPATLEGHTLTLSYPGPADGQVTETYNRK
jgi:hypothetical protein